MNLTEQTLFRIEEIEGQALESRSIMQVKLSLLDYLSACVAGFKILSEQNEQYIKQTGSKGQFAVFGSEYMVNEYSAALLNGMNAHITELDDGHRYAMAHVGASIFSALIPMAVKENVPFERFVKAAIVGYEITVNLAEAMQPYHKNRGYHTTGTCGTIGAAMSVSTAFCYNRDQKKAALSAAVTNAAGILEIQEDGSRLKAYNVGHAAVDGIVSASVGRLGMAAPNDILGGKRGLFSVMGEGNTGTLFCNEELAIWGIYRKPYASCRHSHSAIEAAINIKNRYKIDIDRIREICIRTYKAAIFGHNHNVIQGSTSAKMSIPYSVAVALYFGDAGIARFESAALENIRVQKLAMKIRIEESEILTRQAPAKRAAEVEIVTDDGEVYKESVEYPKGEPENPMGVKDISEKYMAMAEFAGIDSNKARKTVDTILNL